MKIRKTSRAIAILLIICMLLRIGFDGNTMEVYASNLAQEGSEIINSQQNIEDGFSEDVAKEDGNLEAGNVEDEFVDEERIHDEGLEEAYPTELEATELELTEHESIEHESTEHESAELENEENLDKEEPLHKKRSVFGGIDLRSFSMFAVASITPFETVTGTEPLPVGDFAALQKGTYYAIDCFDQWFALAEYSKQSDLDGYKFCYILNNTNGSNDSIYDFTTAKVNNALFPGIGDDEHPFSGELFANYAVGTITLKMSMPLFNNLSSKATVKNIDILTAQTPAGLAMNLTVDASKTDLCLEWVSIKRLMTTDMSKNVYNPSGVAGGLFGNVVNSTDQVFKLSAKESSVDTTVRGVSAGGLIGTTRGKIELSLSGISVLPDYVGGYCRDESVDSFVGGLVGSVNGDFTLYSSFAVTLGHNKYGYDTNTVRMKNAGAVFGEINDSHVKINSSIRCNGYIPVENEGRPVQVYGKNTGGFAGYIKNSLVELNAPIKINSVPLSISSGGTLEENGAGGFVGVLYNSEITSENATSSDENIIEITTKSGYSNVNTNQKLYNVGGIVGYSYNSNLKFTAEHICKVTSFETSTSRGNIGGLIGLYQVDEGVKVIENGLVNFIRLVCRNGNGAGLIGYVKLGNGAAATIRDCSYDGEFSYCISDSLTQDLDGVISPGIARVEDTSVNSKIIVDNVFCNYAPNNLTSINYAKSFGGIIAHANADFEISNSKVTVNGTTVISGSNLVIEHFGGIVGEIVSSNGATRKCNVSNISVGSCGFKETRDALGGLFGQVNENCAVSIAGYIDANGNNGIVQQELFEKKNLKIGSIAGEIDNALIYFEPGSSFNKSTKYSCDEIGNYGGVIRNGYYDNNDSELLIDNYQVTGLLSDHIDTSGDLVRFAIAMNTEGIFMPSENKEEAAGIKSINDVRNTNYILSAPEYDISESGLMCLMRNDEEGIAYYNFAGSFTGVPEKSTIKYNTIAYDQTGIGLFSMCENASFNNMNLDYSIGYMNFKSNTYIKNLKYEYAGGICAFARGNISIHNVSYNARINGIYNSKKSEKEFYENKHYDYLGGLVGCYLAEADSTLDIDGVTANINFQYRDYSHVMGGVVAYINLDNIAGGSTCKVNVENVNLGGKINLNDSAKENNDAKEKVFLASPFITLIGDLDKPGNQFEKKCLLTCSHIAVDDFVQQFDKNMNVYATGGFLGYKWNDIDVSIDDVKIGTHANASILCQSSIGGLVHTVHGAMSLDNVSYGAEAYFDVNGSLFANHSGFLVRDGQYLYLRIKNYDINSECAFGHYSNSSVGTYYYDELVGITKGGDDDFHGGIVSIEGDDGEYYLGRYGKAYNSYRESNKAGNPKTRYYYDLNKLGEWTDYSSISSSDDMMMWHLLHYANESIRKCIDPNYRGLPANYTFTNDINMSGYSIYPTPSVNEQYDGQDHTITFNANKIISEENSYPSNIYKKCPEVDICQHYGMHSGVFSDVAGLTVNSLKLLGSYSKLCDFSGALVAGKIYGIEQGTDIAGNTLYDSTIKNSFSNIEIRNLWCVSKDDIVYNAPIGLMIANITSGADVSFDGIRMTEYSAGDIEENKRAASALIGNVGGENATYITLSFKNMDIADAATGKSSESLNSTKSDEALAKASFIYSFNYESNCNGIYTFSYDDYLNGRCNSSSTKSVTLGKELGNNGENPNYALEEYFDVDIPVGQMQNSDAGIIFDCNNYIPYVYSIKSILINPKVGSLTLGCGTYEDPYILQNERQFMSLYRYLYDEDKFSESFVSGLWKINEFGSDERVCDKSLDTDSGHRTANYLADNFPTKEQLSSAYYKMPNDIDLTDYIEFTGFGRDDMPFSGVLVGAASINNVTITTITMPKQTGSKPVYGFVQVAKGCVIKDLTLEYTSATSINNTVDSVDDGGIAGGVIAIVAGGENVIDNTIVKGKAFEPQNHNTVIGGFVGAVNLGGLILRRMSSESLSEYSVNLPQNEGIRQYPYTCGAIGRVYDGYVVNDDNDTSREELFNEIYYLAESMQGNDLCRSYGVVNANYLRNNLGGTKINWDSSTKTYTIHNKAQLMVLQMALNSGMLNYANDTEYMVGYNYASRQRNGNYDYIGEVDPADAILARDFVVNSDNKTGEVPLNQYSFLSEFFDWGSESLSDVLNPADSVITVKLEAATYDMGAFRSAFRGFGASYYRGDNVFHGNFIGDENDLPIIKLDMKDAQLLEVSDMALLNDMASPSGENQNVKIANLILSGSINNRVEDSEEIKNAAGITCVPQNLKLTLENVILDELTVEANDYSAGFVVANLYEPIEFINCGITASNSTEVEANYIWGDADVGGFVSYSDKDVSISGISKLDHVWINSGVPQLRIDKTPNGIGGNAGGLVGRMEATFSIDGDASGLNNAVEAENIRVQSNGYKVQVGGLVGSANVKLKNLMISNISLNNLTVENGYLGAYVSTTTETGVELADNVIATGGIIGCVACTLTIKNVSIGSKDDSKYTDITFANPNNIGTKYSVLGSGGFIGRAVSGSRININGCKLLGTYDSDKGYTTHIDGKGNVGGLSGNIYGGTIQDVEVDGAILEALTYAGGTVGYVESASAPTFTDISIKNVLMQLEGETFHNSADRGAIGGVIGHNQGFISLNNCNVDSVNIKPKYCYYAGGLIGNTSSTGFTTSFNLKVNSDSNTSCSVTRSLICGNIAGGAIGAVSGRDNSYDNVYNIRNITIADNKIVSCMDNGLVNAKKYSCAGGAVGSLGLIAPYSLIYEGKNERIEQQYTYWDNISLSNNLISAYSNDNHSAGIGGFVGRDSSRATITKITLEDNYIGMLDSVDLGSTEEERYSRLAGIDNESLSAFLYYVSDKNLDGELEFVTDKISQANIDYEDYYKFSYYQGAIVGQEVDSNTNNTTISKYIDVHVDYSDPQYRPVSDVGISSLVKSVNQMSLAYQKQCTIVYNSLKDVESDLPEDNDPIVINAQKSLYAIDNVMHKYLSGDEPKTAYRLDNNYQDLRAINSDNNVQFYEQLSVEKVYENTFRDSSGLKSPFNVPGIGTLPMVVYSSADTGSLDQILHTYINILTNNSGGANGLACANDRKNCQVKTFRVTIDENGMLGDWSETSPSVTVKTSNANNRYKYEFVSTRGDDFYSENEGTFTMVQVNYLGNTVSDGAAPILTYYIPVYVEKRMKINSNMKMLDGINYNTYQLQTNGSYVLESDASKQAMTLPRGNSYSIYMEYIYTDLLNNIATLNIPKTFSIVTDAQVNFLKDTRLTLVPLDEKSKPYYTTVNDSTSREIDFTSFVDADGNPYNLVNLVEAGATHLDNYTDICDVEYTDVMVERFVLLVDTSRVQETRANSLYEMHITPNKLWDNNSLIGLRSDYNEHCFAYVNEIDSISYKINKNKETGADVANTYLASGSRIAEGGSAKLHLQYDIKAESIYWSSMNQEKTDESYLDVGLYIAVDNGGRIQKIPIPDETVITFGEGDDAVSMPATSGQVLAYYYQSINNYRPIENREYICINDLNANISRQIDIALDFSNADLSSLAGFENSQFYIGAELIITRDKELPGAGEIKDTCEFAIDAEAKSDIGFAVDVDELMNLGMNQYMPEETDSGVIHYTTSIDFSSISSQRAEDKYYTIVYQLEKKTSQGNGSSASNYEPYTGSDIKVYLGDIEAANLLSDGIVAVTYKFSSAQIVSGADMIDGVSNEIAEEELTPGIIKTHCTLIADCDKLDMTNYRLKAYLIISDSQRVEGLVEGSTNYVENANGEECMKEYLKLSDGWKTIDSSILNDDLKNDFFVFTVAKIKTSMR